jgi:hypothetical protein
MRVRPQKDDLVDVDAVVAGGSCSSRCGTRSRPPASRRCCRWPQCPNGTLWRFASATTDNVARSYVGRARLPADFTEASVLVLAVSDDAVANATAAGFEGSDGRLVVHIQHHQLLGSHMADAPLLELEAAADFDATPCEGRHVTAVEAAAHRTSHAVRLAAQLAKRARYACTAGDASRRGMGPAREQRQQQQQQRHGERQRQLRGR